MNIYPLSEPAWISFKPEGDPIADSQSVPDSAIAGNPTVALTVAREQATKLIQKRCMLIQSIILSKPLIAIHL